MKLNRSDLRKIIYDFNSISNRLLQANYQDYNIVLSKFINFIKNNELIYEYIKSCGECEQDLDKEFSEVASSYGRAIFSLGYQDEEEVRNVFAILSHIVEKDIEIQYGVAWGYSSSRKFQDIVEGFNDRVVMVLIHHIERYLTKIGIDMGIDEKVTYSISVQNGQVNIANDNSTINATNVTHEVDFEKLTKLIDNIKRNAIEISKEDEEKLQGSLDTIKDELSKENPKKSILKFAKSGLQTIKGSVEFSAAVTALFEYIQPFL